MTALNASIGHAVSIAFDTLGNTYIADGPSNHLFKIDTSGNLTLVAGNGAAGYSGDGGPATSATLGNPEGIFVDGSGNIFIADTDNCVIREVSAGNISTVAGTKRKNISRRIIASSARSPALERLSDGDLTYRLSNAFAAEYEKIRADFNASVEKLQQTMLHVSANTSAIRAGTKEITVAPPTICRGAPSSRRRAWRRRRRRSTRSRRRCARPREGATHARAGRRRPPKSDAEKRRRRRAPGGRRR